MHSLLADSAVRVLHQVHPWKHQSVAIQSNPDEVLASVLSKVRTLSGQGISQDGPFYDLVCEMGLFHADPKRHV